MTQLVALLHFGACVFICIIRRFLMLLRLRIGRTTCDSIKHRIQSDRVRGSLCTHIHGAACRQFECRPRQSFHLHDSAEGWSDVITHVHNCCRGSDSVTTQSTWCNVLHSGGAKSCGRIGSVTSGVSGVPNTSERGTKSKVAQMWAGWRHNSNGLGGPQRFKAG